MATYPVSPSRDPRVRKLLGWRALVAHDDRTPMQVETPATEWQMGGSGPVARSADSAATLPPMPSASGILPISTRTPGDPESIHREQQARAGARVPQTEASGAGLSMFRSGAGVPGALGDVVRGVGSIVSAALPELVPGGIRRDVLGDMPVAHAAEASDGAGQQHPLPPDYRQMPTRTGNEERFDPAKAAAAMGRGGGQGGPASIEKAAAEMAGPPTAQIRPSVPRAGSGHTYTNADLAIEHAQGPSRGGFMAGSTDNYIPDSVIEQAARKAQLEELQVPPGEVSPRQRAALKLAGEQAEIKYAAMDKLIDDDFARFVQEVNSNPKASPEQKALAIRNAREEALQHKLDNRRLGMAGWPRGNEMGLSGEPLWSTGGGGGYGGGTPGAGPVYGGGGRG